MITKFINITKSKPGFGEWDSITAITFVITVFAIIPAFILNPQGTGADFGYMQALNWIRSHRPDLKFGVDIAYTYGPLGFLQYRVVDNWKSFLLILAFDLYLFINLLIILRAFMPVKSILGSLAVFFAVYLFDKRFFNDSGCYIGFSFSVFMFLKGGKYKYLLNAIFLSLLGFFIKVNFGLLQFFFLTVVIAYASIYYKNRRLYVVTFCLTIATLFGLAYILHVNIPGYLVSSLQVIGGYNEAQVLPFSHTLAKFEIALAILILYCIVCLYYIYNNKFYLPFVLRFSITALFIFMSFKHAFVLCFFDNIYWHFAIMTIAIGIHYLFEAGAYKERLQQLAIVSLIVTSGLFLNIYSYFGRSEIKNFLSLESFGDILNMGGEKFMFSEDVRKSRVFPDRVLKRIGSQPVDLLGYNTSLLFINGLNYSPRPSIQSYTGYNTYLDSMNCRKYLSPHAPRFILFTCRGYMDRYPFWDESITKRAVAQNYQVVDSFYTNDANCGIYFTQEGVVSTKYLLLEKRSTALQLSHQDEKQTWGVLNKRLIIDQDTTEQFLHADFEYTLAGKAEALFIQPAIIHVTLGYESGKEETFRAVVPILKTGVLINRRVTNTDEADIFFRTNGQGNERIKWVKFVASDGFSFKNDFKFYIEKYYIKN